MGLQELDQTILLWITEHMRGPVFDGFMAFFTRLGDAGAIFILTAVLLAAFKKTRKAGVCALVSMLFGLIVTNLTVKPLVSRPRPWVVMEGLTALVSEHDPNSFPSGHTCAAFAFGVALCIVLPRKWAKAAALIAAALMGFSRLYVGVHFPSDVLAGAVIGTICALLGVWVVKRTETWFQSRKAAG